MKAFFSMVLFRLKAVPRAFSRLWAAIRKGELTLRPNKKYFTRKWIALYAACAVAVAAGGFFLWVELTYSEAVRHTESGDYTQAAEFSTKLPFFYKDASQLLQYDEAGAKMLGGQFAEAKQAFFSLGEYRNAKSMTREVDYKRAQAYLGQGKFVEAKSVFSALGDYSDAQAMVMESDYLAAKSLLAAGNFSEAKAGFQTLGSYKDAQTMVTETDYQKAQSQLAAGEYKTAKKSFAALGAYKDSQLMVTEADYRQAQADLKNGNYEAAAATFQTLGAYKDSQNMALEANYARAQDCLKKGDFATAIQLFSSLGDFKDSKAMVTESTYQKALADLDAGDFGGAQEAFKNLGDYKDSKKMVTECSYRHAKALISSGDFLDAYGILQDIGGYADAKDLLANLQDSIYSRGVDLYRSGDLGRAQQYFEKVQDYSRSADYLKLISAQNSPSRSSLYTLEAFSGFENAAELIVSSAFIQYYLDGYWSSGADYFYLSSTEIDFSFESDFSYYYSLTDGALVSGFGNTILEFTYVSSGMVRVYSNREFRTVTLYRD